jgi:putative FmdB family regulatory protein
VPTYEYACGSCDTTHEIQQSMSDPTLTVCPACGQATLRKLFRGVGIHFKGSGFYRTDSRGSSGTSGTSDTSSTSSTSAPSTGAGSSSSSTPAASTTTSSSTAASSAG